MDDTAQKLLPAGDVKPAQQLVDLFGEPELALFFVTWLKNGMNATKAYLELHPHVTYESARTLGHRLFTKVNAANRSAVLASYGLDYELYFTQLKEGIAAEKWNEFSGEREADHFVRDKYHTKLGRLLGIDTQAPSTLIQVNGNDMSIAFADSNDGKTP